MQVGLVSSLWQGLLVAASVATLLAIVRRPALRYQIASFGLLVMVFWPVLTAAEFALSPTPVSGTHQVQAPEWEVSPLDGAVTAAQAELIPESAPEPGSMTQEHRPASTSVHAIAVLIRSASFSKLLTILWFAGVGFGIVRLSVGLLQVKRMQRSAALADRRVADVVKRMAATLRLRVEVEVLESTRLAAPVVVGALRPVLLLPVGLAASLPVAQFEAVVAHELAHVLRRDYLVNLLQRLAETLLFHHPAAWWLSSVVRREREHLCDDAAVRACGGDALPLASGLAALAARRGAAPLVSVAATGASSHNGALRVRVQRLLQGGGGERRGYAALTEAARPAIFLAALAMFAPVLAQVERADPLQVEHTLESFGSSAPFTLQYGHHVSSSEVHELYIALNAGRYVPSAVNGVELKVRDSEGQLLAEFDLPGTYIERVLPINPRDAASLEVHTEVGSWSVPMDAVLPAAGFGAVHEIWVENQEVPGGAVLRWEPVPGAKVYEVGIQRESDGTGRIIRTEDPWAAVVGFEGSVLVYVRAYSENPAVPKQVMQVNVGQGQRVRIDLPSAPVETAGTGDFQGTVRTVTGPAAGVGVTVFPSPVPTPGQRNISTPVGSATTGADGSFRVEGLPPGAYHVQLSGQGAANSNYEHVSNVVYVSTVAAGQTTTAPTLFVAERVDLIAPAVPSWVAPGEVGFEWEWQEGAHSYFVTLLRPLVPEPFEPAQVVVSAQVLEPHWEVALEPAQEYELIIEGRDAAGNIIGLRKVVVGTRAVQ